MPLLTKNKYGHVIDKINCPLYSNKTAELKTLNEKLLAAMSEAANKDKENSLQDEIKNTRKQLYTITEHVLTGGGYLPVYDAQGTQTGITDVTPVETKFEKMKKEVSELRRELNKVKSEKATSQHYPHNNRNYDTAYQRNRNNRNREYRGRGNRGRGRGLYSGSGYNDKDNYEVQHNQQYCMHPQLTQNQQGSNHKQLM